LQDEAGGASHIQDTAHRQWIAANRIDHETHIAKPMMNGGNIAISTLRYLIGHTQGIQYLGLVSTDHHLNYDLGRYRIATEM
jgi:hypothetical protein